MKVIFKNNYIEISHDEANNWIYANWQNVQSLESIQTAGLRLLEIVRTTGCKKVLNDNRLVTGTWTYATEWTVNVFFPKLVSVGITQFAWIYSKDVFSKFSIDRVTKHVLTKDIIQNFSNIQEAQQWLQEPETKQISA